MCALRTSSCKTLVKMNSLNYTEDTETMPSDTKGANDTEVAKKAAMAGKLTFEQVETVIKQDDAKHLRVNEYVKEVSKPEKASEVKDKSDHQKVTEAAKIVPKAAYTKANAEPKERPDKADPGMEPPDADHHSDAAKIVPNDLRDAYTKATAEPKEKRDKADPVMDPPDRLLTHE